MAIKIINGNYKERVYFTFENDNIVFHSLFKREIIPIREVIGLRKVETINKLNYVEFTFSDNTALTAKIKENDYAKIYESFIKKGNKPEHLELPQPVKTSRIVIYGSVFILSIFALALLTGIKNGYGDAKLKHSIPTECYYLENSNLPTSGWINHNNDEYGCSSSYFDIGTGSPLPNNIAYYVEGDSKSAHSAKLVMNINNKKQEKEAKAAFTSTAKLLSRQVVKSSIPNEFWKSIENNKNKSIIIDDKKISVTSINWPNGNGYETHITFKLK
ncbi:MULTISPECIES: hypothetical protein [Aeromonas]|uniref:hypothetical protein n=1 Tax=Aeromonas TaxID=642 RepID=UPI001F2BAF87|nr:hypothetical protein [Aeromonas veronii]EKP0276778.1 hypothetical protein [Aeromonas bestiarum]MCF5914270.1 hypothetical protein [Aeromonas veronii]HDT6076794.1 hypothetical protein [Aeromonas veronii bv. veronii]